MCYIFITLFMGDNGKTTEKLHNLHNYLYIIYDFSCLLRRVTHTHTHMLLPLQPLLTVTRCYNHLPILCYCLP
jgi:hypothetical protein